MTKEIRLEPKLCPWCNVQLEMTYSHELKIYMVRCPDHTLWMGIEQWNTRVPPESGKPNDEIYKAFLEWLESGKLDREDAEKYAEEIWEECATTDAIASYLQRRFGRLNEQAKEESGGA